MKRGCEKFVPALAYLFCLALPGSCLTRFAYILADLCMRFRMIAKEEEYLQDQCWQGKRPPQSSRILLSMQGLDYLCVNSQATNPTRCSWELNELEADINPTRIKRCLWSLAVYRMPWSEAFFSVCLLRIFLPSSSCSLTLNECN